MPKSKSKKGALIASLEMQKKNTRKLEIKKGIPNLVFKSNLHNQIWHGAQKKEKENSSRSNSHLQHNICCSIKVFWLYYNSVGNSVAGILDFVAAKGAFIYYISTYLIDHNIFTNLLSIFFPSLCTKKFKLQAVLSLHGSLTTRFSK